MADGKKNPLIGAFRTPAAETPPKVPEQPAPAESKKVTEPLKAAADSKTPPTTPVKPSEKKPTEPDKVTAPAPIPGKSDAEKKPTEQPKTADTKVSTIIPGKTDVEKKPTDPPKTAADLKIAAPGKADKGKKEAEAPKPTTEVKAPVAPGKPMEEKKPAEPPKTTEAVKPATAPTPAAKTSEEKKTEDTPKPKEDEEFPEDFKLPITKEGQSEIITTLKVSEIHPFEGHPFNVKDDKDMMDLADSVKKFGVLEPVVVIPRKEGGYEMVSGHRRRRACELAGITTMPVIVRQLDRDEAVISMVDANLKRENISPMEKARAYAMKLEAMKHKAGRRTKAENAALEAAGKKPMRADEELAQQTGESRSNIQKLVRLNSLTPELQQMVDDKKLPVHTAADLSYLKKEEQSAVADAIKKEDKVPSGSQAVELKKASQEGKLTTEKIEKAVAPTKREETPPLKIVLAEEDLRPYFPDKRTTIPDVKRGVFEALDLRKKALERQKAKMQAEKDPKKKSEPSR